MKLLAATALLAVLALPAHAMHRCVTPAGGVVFTDEKCEAIGLAPERQSPEAAPKPKPADKKAPPRPTTKA